MSNTVLINGDCFEALDKLEDNSIGSVVSDPPYLINFMNKGWDNENNIAGNPELYKKLITKMKAGSYVALFGHSRTHHRIMVALEEAGFELRDTLTWLYGSGFPKNHNIGKAIDKKLGGKREVISTRPLQGNGKTMKSGFHQPDGTGKGNTIKQDVFEITAPATDEAKEWEGYGTALKPAVEFIVLAQKPRDGTFVNNVLTHGVGGLNIDGCRINYNGEVPNAGGRANHGRGDGYGYKAMGDTIAPNTDGRFPANLILDEEAGRMLDEQSGTTKTVANKNYKWNNKKCEGDTFTSRGTYTPREGKGGASRFFYCPKVSKKERELGCDELEEKTRTRVNAGGLENDPKFAPVQNRNDHPTLKPVSLMRWLVRLTTPPNETCLDLFMGAGSTGGACALEGRDFIGVERDEHYFEIATARIEAWKKEAENEEN